MKSRKYPVADQGSCANCGGTHFGSPKDYCPYTNAPCSFCGEDTIYACSDCKIDTGKSVHVCGALKCQIGHEKLHEKREARNE